MDGDDEFTPRPGRQANRGSGQGRSYLGRVLAATNRAGSGRPSGSRFQGSRTGRAAGTGRLLARRGGGAASRQRRVVVKTSIVKLAGRGASAATAHLRYLQRDGTTREGLPGQLYSADADVADGVAFRNRGAGDRHQFRFIVSAEDGNEYEDLKPLTRRLMERVAGDLGTPLDWVAVDHFNTGHPHTHVVVRGADHRGRDLVIARDYLTHGLRERAAELVDLDLGPRSDREIADTLRAEMDHERLTTLDRTLIRDAEDGLVAAHGGSDPPGQSLRAGRLAKLARMGLAEPAGAGRYRLAPDLEQTLRRMGERDDIIRTMQRIFTATGLERAAADQAVYEPGAREARPLTGRVVARGLHDEHADRHFLIVEATDGRAHYVATGAAANVEALPPGAIVRIEPASASVRAADHTIATVAACHGGRYDVDLHLRHDPAATEAFARAHVRRLEAMRRAGAGVNREPSGSWIIAPDHLARVAAWEQDRLQERPVAVALLATGPLDQLAVTDAPTWLDHELVAGSPEPLRDAGFGREIRAAQLTRQRWLVGQNLAREEDGLVRCRPGMLAALQRRELLRVAGQLSDELGLPFAESASGSRVEGVYRRPVVLTDRRMALVERAHEFTLVPWRPVLEPHAGRTVSGVLRGDSVSWSIGRSRGGPAVS